MKQIKIIIMLAAVAMTFASCSDDDETYNSNEVTVGFAADEYSVRENAKYIDIPINVQGLRNGKVSLTITAEGTGENPAQEYVDGDNPGNYVITDKTLTLNADDSETGTINVQVAPIDDEVMNSNRSLRLTIAAASGATITTASTTLTIIDNDSFLYDRFVGTWYLSGTYETTGETFSKAVTVTGTSDETRPEYNNILTASSVGLVSIKTDTGGSIAVDCNWHFRYSFDETTGTGTLGFICGEDVASVGSSYIWTWMTGADEDHPTSDDVTAAWSLGDGNSIPTEIVFPEDANLYLWRTGQAWEALHNLKLTR